MIDDDAVRTRTIPLAGKTDLRKPSLENITSFGCSRCAGDPYAEAKKEIVVETDSQRFQSKGITMRSRISQPIRIAKYERMTKTTRARCKNRHLKCADHSEILLLWTTRP